MSLHDTEPLEDRTEGLSPKSPAQVYFVNFSVQTTKEKTYPRELMGSWVDRGMLTEPQGGHRGSIR